MTISVALAPAHSAALQRRLEAVYDRRSSRYHQWLSTGQFAHRYGPSDRIRHAVTRYLRAHGLDVSTAASPFLIRATGSSDDVSAAFHTRLSSYRNARGVRYFSNSTAVRLPPRLASHVNGVIGLSNTLRAHSSVKRTPFTGLKGARKSTVSCEAPYPTAQQLFDAVNNGVGFPFGYGGGPGCNGLTPSQDNGIYGAPHVGSRGKGAGADVAVFELSAYQHSDIDTWTKQFYGASFHAPLVDVDVDGGPLNPQCPTGDTCPPQFEGYAGDIEVVADIQMELAMAPAVRHLIVYNAPNDFTGQTELDEWTRIADDNTADTISSSWGICENDIDAGYAQAENLLFEQMALQGQSVFGASGDTGSYDCIRADGSTILNVNDPPSQPWVTSVGGTSFEHFNPGTTQHPNYPHAGEAPWNVDNLCNDSADEGGHPGFFWCGATGAGGGGSSQFWGRPFYQRGPGVISSDTVYGNGSTHCSLARVGTPCRETPDISADADEYTPYAEYCTGSAATPFSVCATFSDQQTPPGWFGIGGTSLSSPLWAGIAVDRVSYTGHRFGNANPLLYLAYNAAPRRFFHDVTGAG
ncbi:MAG TPA: S53 family peptidase, partial [Nocardioidaceae bacterium]